MAGTRPPRWRVQFDDGETRENIWLANPKTPVRFDPSANGFKVKARVDGGAVRRQTRRGRQGVTPWETGGARDGDGAAAVEGAVR